MNRSQPIEITESIIFKLKLIIHHIEYLTFCIYLLFYFILQCFTNIEHESFFCWHSKLYQILWNTNISVIFLTSTAVLYSTTPITGPINTLIFFRILFWAASRNHSKKEGKMKKHSLSIMRIPFQLVRMTTTLL